MMTTEPHVIEPQARTARLALVRDEVVPTDELIVLVTNIQSMLAPLVQPVALDLYISARPPDSSFPDVDAVMPKPTWCLCQDPAPHGVAYRVPTDRSQELRSAPVLDEPTVAAWVREALAQGAPNHVPTLSTLRMTHTRARLLSPELVGAQTMAIFDGPTRHELPIEQRDDGEWVSGAVRPILARAPIAVSLEYDGRLFQLYLTVSWSPWATEGTAEHAAFCTCLKRLLTLSWEADGVPPVFERGMR